MIATVVIVVVFVIFVIVVIVAVVVIDCYLVISVCFSLEGMGLMSRY